MSREDYIANACSYSIGFVERDACILVIHQMQWNRLDIMDAKTGECLTEREVSIREASFAEPDEQWMPPNYAVKNYIDYFHSLLHVSPDGSSFLSNGWIWHPLGQILCFRTHDFLKRYEPVKVEIEYNHAYNWDIPCAYISNDRFVIAVDDLRKDARLDAEALEGYQYRQLQFYNLNHSTCETQYGELVLRKEYERDCSAFTLDEEGQVHGQLVWDPTFGCLVAITPDGTFTLDMDGNIMEAYPDCKFAKGYHDQNSNDDLGWRYSPERHVLYHWSQETGMVEERKLDYTKP